MKKNFLKKILSLLLSIMIIFGISIETYAYEKNDNMENNVTFAIEDNFGSLALEIINNAEVYEVGGTDFSNIEILNEVDINNINTQSSYSVNQTEDNYEVTNLPVVIDGKIELILSLMKTDEGYNATLGRDFAPLLNEVQLNGDNDVSIIQDGFTLYAITPNKTYKQVGSTVIDITEENETFYNINGAMFSTNEISSADYNTTDLCDINDSYTQAALESLTVEKENNNIQPYSNPVSPTGTKYLSNYPIVHQRIGSTQYGMCWAATVASIVRFEGKSSTLTAQQVCNRIGIGYDDGGTLENARAALAIYLSSPYVPTVVNSTLSYSNIMTVINNVDPAYMSCKNGDSGHAVALVGYNFTTTKKEIRIMDPAYECFKTCTHSLFKWTFPFGSDTYTWKYTVRLLYS